MSTVGDVTDIIGHFGAWQKFYFAVMTFICGVTAWPALSMTFLAPNVPFHCREDPNSTCRLADNDTKCHQWTFDHSVYTNTLTEKFEFVCDNAWMISLSSSINMIGDVVGALFLGYLADRFGRRPVVLGAIVPGVVSNLLILFSPNIALFMVAKFLAGLAGFSAFTVGFVLLMEMVGEAQRPLLGIGVEFGWALAYILLPGFAWALRDWFYVQLIITCFVCSFVFLWWVIPESPRWLLLHGRVEQAEKVVKKALKWNGIEFSNLKAELTNISNALQESSKHQRNYTIKDLFRTRELRKHTLVLAFYWFVNGFVFYGISLNSEIFGGNTFLNFFLFGVVEFPAYLAAIPIVHYAGRKSSLAIYMLGAGAICLITIPVENHYTKVFLVCFGKFFIASSFALIYPYTTEVYPTGVRTIAIGTCNFFARVATVLAPYVNELAKATSLWVPMCVFGVLGLLSGAAVWFLPETKGQIMPETLEDGEMLGRSRSTSKS